MNPLAAAIVISCMPSQADLARGIERMSWAPKAQRAERARQLAARVLIEARRWRLDPVALAAIGSVESDYRPRPRGPGAKPRGFGRRIFEFGTFQLIPQSGPVRHAARVLAKRCKPPVKLASLACPREVWAARKRTGSFSRAELEDYTIGTWVAALEIRMALDGCRLRHPRGHGWRVRWWVDHYAKRHKITPREARHLARWGHYNSGSAQPLLRYIRRLVERYARLRRLVCRGRDI